MADLALTFEAKIAKNNSYWEYEIRQIKNQMKTEIDAEKVVSSTFYLLSVDLQQEIEKLKADCN